MPDPTDPGEQKVIDDVREYGWHVVNVLAEGDLPEFTYTIGLYQNYRHPEILVYGLPRDRAHPIVNELGEGIRNGEVYLTGKTYGEILQKYSCTFRAIPSSQYLEHLGWAMWFYEGPEFPALQLVYPDSAGRWPWQDGVAEGFRQRQPILADAGAPPRGVD